MQFIILVITNKMEEDDNYSQQVSELQSLESIYTEELKVLVADKELMVN